jgi:hypothetical protein
MRQLLIMICSLIVCNNILAQKTGINWPQGYFINAPLSVNQGKDVYNDTAALLQVGKDTSNKGTLLTRGFIDSLFNPHNKKGLLIYDYKDSVLYHLDGTKRVRYMTYKDTVMLKAILDGRYAHSGLATSSLLTENTNTLLGRTSAATGAIEEIAPGTGLVLNGGILNVSAVPNTALQNSLINFGTGSAGSAPNWSSSSTALGGTATLNLPAMAGSGVTLGLLSNSAQTMPGLKTLSDGIKLPNGIAYNWAAPSGGDGFLKMNGWLFSLGDGNGTYWDVNGNTGGINHYLNTVIAKSTPSLTLSATNAGGVSSFLFNQSGSSFSEQLRREASSRQLIFSENLSGTNTDLLTIDGATSNVKVHNKLGIGMTANTGYDLSVLRTLVLGPNGTSGGYIGLKTRGDFLSVDAYSLSVNNYNFTIGQTPGAIGGRINLDFGTTVGMSWSWNTVYNWLEFNHTSSNVNTSQDFVWNTPGGGAGTKTLYIGTAVGVGSPTNNPKNSIVFFRKMDGAFADVATEPVIAIRNGHPQLSAGNLVRDVGYWYRNGCIGIGTTNSYSANTTAVKGGLSINFQARSGYTNNDQTVASNVKTSGTSTLISFTGNGNGTVDPMITVGTKITANGVSRYVGSFSSATTAALDNAVDWSNGGSGYPYTYQLPYLTIDSVTQPILHVNTDGYAGFRINGKDITSHVDINGLQGYNQLRLRTSYTPSSTLDGNGKAGDIAWDENYFYIKTTEGWKRMTLFSF